MKTLLHIYTRLEWRQWLEQNFRSEKEAWLVFPAKSTGKAGILYNDAVEEALCFGWIDSIRPIRPDPPVIKTVFIAATLLL